MARTKGIFPFTGTLEVASTAPLDARLLVKTKADLMLEDTWKNGNSIYLYNHIVVTVEDVEGQFMLTNYDPTTAPTAYQNEANWVRLDTKVDNALIFLTQEEYDLLGTDIKKDTIYIITNDTDTDTPELEVQGPFIIEDGLLKEAGTIEDNNYYVFKVNNDYFFIYKSSSIISLPKDLSLYKKVTGNFQILQSGRKGEYEYCVPEVVDVESLDDISMEDLLKDITIVDSLGSQESIEMNYYSEGFRDYSEQGTFNGIYVNTNNGNIELDSTKILGRAPNRSNPTIIYYQFPNTLHTYHIDDNRNIISQECLNKNNYKIYDYLNDSFIGTKKLEFIKKNNTTYDKELTAVSKKTGLDLTNRLDFNNDSNIIVGKIIEFE